MHRESILVIRIGAMGDIIHALPAVESLRRSFPETQIEWLVAPRWIPLLEGNPAIDRLIPFERATLPAFLRTMGALRESAVQTAIDFQGLIKSAIAGRAARPKRFFGFDRDHVRERPAAWFYSDRIGVAPGHRIEQNLRLAAAAGADSVQSDIYLPSGKPEGALPTGPFVLATPFAGWKGKEWPLPRYNELGACLAREGVPLVANVPFARAAELLSYPHLRPHSSSLGGLIHAVRSACAVLASDSGPLHLAAALRKPGLALFGPTDPASNGPYGSTLRVLRWSDAATTYKRHDHHHPSMLALSTAEVTQALMEQLRVRVR